MVVTGSRLHAVRYKQEFDKYIAEKGYTDIKTLVAFSGTVRDSDVGRRVHRGRDELDGIKEKELPEEFATDEYQVLLVAEKYQTGLRSAAAAHDVRGQAARGHSGRANAVAPEPHSCRQGRHLRPGLRERGGGDPGGVQAVLRSAAGRAAGRAAASFTSCNTSWPSKQVFYPNEVEEFAKVFFKPKQAQIAE